MVLYYSDAVHGVRRVARVHGGCAAGDEELREFQNELLQNPKLGEVMRGTNGLRKARMKLVGRGKSGGARVIYLHLEAAQTIVLFMLYTKARQANLKPEQAKRLAQVVRVIKQTYEK